MRKAIAASVALACLCGSAYGQSSQDQQFDWTVWRSLPVQDAGRQKPLDSLAWETWRLLGNRVSFTDPETKQTLDATAFYVASMLESPNGTKSPSLPSPSGRGAGGEGKASKSTRRRLHRSRHFQQRRQVGRRAAVAGRFARHAQAAFHARRAEVHFRQPTANRQNPAARRAEPRHLPALGTAACVQARKRTFAVREAGRRPVRALAGLRGPSRGPPPGNPSGARLEG